MFVLPDELFSWHSAFLYEFVFLFAWRFSFFYLSFLDFDDFRLVHAFSPFASLSASITLRFIPSSVCRYPASIALRFSMPARVSCVGWRGLSNAFRRVSCLAIIRSRRFGLIVFTGVFGCSFLRGLNMSDVVIAFCRTNFSFGSNALARAWWNAVWFFLGMRFSFNGFLFSALAVRVP